jgi:hypothetical protein
VTAIVFIGYEVCPSRVKKIYLIGKELRSDYFEKKFNLKKKSGEKRIWFIGAYSVRGYLDQAVIPKILCQFWASG